MHRLTGADAGFLYIESESQPSTAVFTAELAARRAADGTPNPVTLPELVTHVAARLDVLPSFRHRLQRVPLGLAHPVWIEDPDFDLDFHVRRTRLGAPGVPATLDGLIAHFAGERLDLRHPLWRLILVDGLADDRQAILFLLHHTWTDGTAARTTIERLLSDRDPGPEARAELPWQPEEVRRRRLVRDALRNQASHARRLPQLVRSTRANLETVKERRAEALVPVPKPLDDTPVCRLNDAFSGDRGYARAQLPVADLRYVRTVAEVSFNDVLLSVVSSAVRAYLEARGQLPDKPLTVNIPMSLEPANAPPRQWGNRFANFIGTLATDVDDPWERTRAISACVAESRLQLELLGPDTIASWLDFAPPMVAEPGAHLWASLRSRNRDKAEYNVLVTNVHGQDEPLNFQAPAGEVVVDEVWGSGPTFDGAGLMVVAWTYGANLNIGVIVNSHAVEAPQELADGLAVALAELVGLARAHDPAAAPTPTAKD